MEQNEYGIVGLERAVYRRAQPRLLFWAARMRGIGAATADANDLVCEVRNLRVPRARILVDRRFEKRPYTLDEACSRNLLSRVSGRRAPWRDAHERAQRGGDHECLEVVLRSEKRGTGDEERRREHVRGFFLLSCASAWGW